MSKFYLFIFLFFSFFQSQDSPHLEPEPIAENNDCNDCLPPPANTQGLLIATRFKSMEELEKVIQIEYFNEIPFPEFFRKPRPMVRVTHHSRSHSVRSNLQSGITESDISAAQRGNFFDKAFLVLRFPFLAIHRKDFMRVFILSRRREHIFGIGDVAFYDLAENMLYHIKDEDIERMPLEDLSEKGFINTFNHFTAQAFMTTLFSERLADFIADTHERTNMIELLTGNFTPEQLDDLEKGPIDNFVDIINNEWGQEMGKKLKKKYQITRKTHWTPELLSAYLNDIQSYYSWAFQIGFQPFRTSDEVVIRFAYKLNRVMKSVKGLN